MFPKRFESVIQWSDGGRSFQARVLVYESTRLPISVRQRGFMYWAVSADCILDLIWLTVTAHTMSEECIGHWPVGIECIIVHNLKSTRRSTGNQWSCLRAGVTCSFTRRLRISRAAALWTSWRAWSPTLADRLTLIVVKPQKNKRMHSESCWVLDRLGNCDLGSQLLVGWH